MTRPHTDTNPLYAHAVRGAAGDVIARDLRLLGCSVQRDGDAYVVDGERLDVGEMWALLTQLNAERA